MDESISYFPNRCMAISCRDVYPIQQGPRNTTHTDRSCCHQWLARARAKVPDWHNTDRPDSRTGSLAPGHVLVSIGFFLLLRVVSFDRVRTRLLQR